MISYANVLLLMILIIFLLKTIEHLLVFAQFGVQIYMLILRNAELLMYVLLFG